jgi:uncharacterized damage-inducible protein DinB
MVRLETVLTSWKTVREDTAQAVEEFPAAELDFKPVDSVMSFREIARHILEASSGIAGLLLAGVDNLAVPDFRALLKQHAHSTPQDLDSVGLGRELRLAFEASRAELAARPASFFAGEITRFDGQRVTRLEMLQMSKEHELTHRSQLFLYLRLKGVVPPTTKRRMAQAKP